MQAARWFGCCADRAELHAGCRRSSRREFHSLTRSLGRSRIGAKRNRGSVGPGFRWRSIPATEWKHYSSITTPQGMRPAGIETRAFWLFTSMTVTSSPKPFATNSLLSSLDAVRVDLMDQVADFGRHVDSLAVIADEHAFGSRFPKVPGACPARRVGPRNSQGCDVSAAFPSGWTPRTALAASGRLRESDIGQFMQKSLSQRGCDLGAATAVPVLHCRIFPV